jgi:hypothetical protein
MTRGVRADCATELALTIQVTDVGDWTYNGQSRGDTWPNHRVPCGTPDEANEGWFKKFVTTSVRLEPMTSELAKVSPNSASHPGTHVTCLNMWKKYYLKLICYEIWG